MAQAIDLPKREQSKNEKNIYIATRNKSFQDVILRFAQGQRRCSARRRAVGETKHELGSVSGDGYSRRATGAWLAEPAGCRRVTAAPVIPPEASRTQKWNFLVP